MGYATTSLSTNFKQAVAQFLLTARDIIYIPFSLKLHLSPVMISHERLF